MTDQPPPPPGAPLPARAVGPAKAPSGRALRALVLLVIVGAVGWGLVSRREAAAMPALARSVETVSGAGIMQSAPVSLGGTYEVAWSARPVGNHECYHGTDLRTTSDHRASDLVSVQVPVAGTSGTVWVYDLDQGEYFVDANSGCQWSFTFTPR